MPGLHPHNADPLTAGQLRAAVTGQPNASFCLHYHSTRSTLTAEDITNWVDQSTGDNNDPVYVDTVHPVPGDTPQRPQDLWIAIVNARTRAVTTDHATDDVVLWDQLHGHDGHPGGPAPITDEARTLTRQVITDRSAAPDFSNGRALAQALPQVEAAADHALRRSPPEFALAQTSEALDRAYNRARIVQAGLDVNLRDLRDLRHLGTYHHF